MPLPRKTYRDWTTEDLQQLLEEPKAEETARVDFKQQCNLLASDKAAKDKARGDILKDVAAMANGVGGALLIGVAETKRPNAPPLADSLPGIPTGEIERIPGTPYLIIIVGCRFG